LTPDTDDRLARPPDNEQRGESGPEHRGRVIPDCGHIPHLERPSQFLGELLPFLARENLR
jgi:pimeloyl-ACP methyl ester carboxylesterase